MHSSRTRLGLGLGLGIVAMSSAALLIRLAEPLPPLVIASGRQLLAGLCLAVASIPAVRALARDLDRRRAWLITASSILLALHFYGWIAALSLTSVVRATTLVCTSPIIAGLLARFNDDEVSPRLYVGAVVALGGALVMSLGSSEGASDPSLLGDALALMGACTVAGYLAIGRKLEGRVALRGYLVVVNVASGVWLSLAALATGAWFSLGGAGAALGPAFGWIVVLALVPGVMGHGLLNWSVRQIPVHVVSTLLLLEAVFAPLLAWMVLGDAIGGYEALGGAIILGGVAVSLVGGRKSSLDGGSSAL